MSICRVPLGCPSRYESAHTMVGQYWQFTSDIIISHACEDDIMFICTLSGYSSPERVNIMQIMMDIAINGFQYYQKFRMKCHLEKFYFEKQPRPCNNCSTRLNPLCSPYAPGCAHALVMEHLSLMMALLLA